jgi:hypothetical protein
MSSNFKKLEILIKKNESKNVLTAVGLIIFAVVVRVLQFIPNVAPVGALAIFSGVYFKKRWAYAVPILAMLISDPIIGYYDARVMATVYGSFILAVLIGRLVAGRKNPLTVMLGALSGSVLFYLTTNFAVWAISSWYPPNFSGLMLSYTMALPFFRNTLLSDLFFTGVFFGAYEGVAYLARKRMVVSKKEAILLPQKTIS